MNEGKGKLILELHDAIWDLVETKLGRGPLDDAMGERVFDLLDSQLDDWLEEVEVQSKEQAK